MLASAFPSFHESTNHLFWSISLWDTSYHYCAVSVWPIVTMSPLSWSGTICCLLLKTTPWWNWEDVTFPSAGISLLSGLSLLVLSSRCAAFWAAPSEHRRVCFILWTPYTSLGFLALWRGVSRRRGRMLDNLTETFMLKI